MEAAATVPMEAALKTVTWPSIRRKKTELAPVARGPWPNFTG
jgi:hypothetical protein